MCCEHLVNSFSYDVLATTIVSKNFERKAVSLTFGGIKIASTNAIKILNLSIPTFFFKYRLRKIGWQENYEATKLAPSALTVKCNLKVHPRQYIPVKYHIYV